HLLNNFQALSVKVCNCEGFMMFNARRLKMNRFAFSAFLVVAALAGNFHDATAQTINSAAQSGSPRVAARRSAPATAAKPIAAARVAPQIGPRPTGLNVQRFNSNLPRTIAQPPANLQNTYSPPVQTLNPTFAALNAHRAGSVQQPITLDPATRQTELRTLAAMRQRRGLVTREGNILDPATRQTELRTLAAMRQRRGLVAGQANMLDAARRDSETRTLETMRERRAFGTNNQTLAAINPRRH